MRVSILLVALTDLLATATAIDADPLPSFGWGSTDREASDSTDRKASGSTIFEKLGFCNSRTLKGRYTGFANGNADTRGVFVGPPTTDPLIVGPESTSSTTYYGTNNAGLGRSFTQTVARTSQGPGALGAPEVINTWSELIIAKNCSVIEQGVVIEYLSPEHLIIPDRANFLFGFAAPDGSDLVSTVIVTSRINAFSGEKKRVSKTALPPQQFIDGPPRVPQLCSAAQSCESKYEGVTCTDDDECRFFCFPFCEMSCLRRLGDLEKICLRTV